MTKHELMREGFIIDEEGLGKIIFDWVEDNFTYPDDTPLRLQFLTTEKDGETQYAAKIFPGNRN